MEHTILLVQNDPEERSRVVRAFGSVAPNARLCTVSDDAEAFGYVSGVAKYADRTEYPLPQVIVLDIDGAKDTGLETVRLLRAEAVHLGIPVVGITSGADKDVIDRAYKLGASSCVLKSEDESILQQFATGIADYAALLKSRTTTATVRVFAV